MPAHPSQEHRWRASRVYFLAFLPLGDRTWPLTARSASRRMLRRGRGARPRSRGVCFAVLLVALVGGALAFHVSTGLDPRALEWSLVHELVTDSDLLRSCAKERARCSVCHELEGDNVPFSVEREGRRCWRVKRTLTTRGGKAGTVAARGCYDGWDRLERALGGGPSVENSEPHAAGFVKKEHSLAIVRSEASGASKATA